MKKLLALFIAFALLTPAGGQSGTPQIIYNKLATTTKRLQALKSTSYKSLGEATSTKFRLNGPRKVQALTW